MTTLKIITKTETLSIDLDSFVHKLPTQTHPIEEVIIHYDQFLERLATPRAKINELKKAKDRLIKEYIFMTKAPKTLDLNLLNYKALLFYFKDSFMKRSLALKYLYYNRNNDLSALQEGKKDSLVNHFCNGKIEIKLTYENFPHLIGIRKPTDSRGNVINHNFIDEFLDDIFYETKVLEDFRSHKGDENKIKSFSWIYATLQNPTMILERDAIKSSSKFGSDLIFVKKIFNSTEYKYHIVGLSRVDCGCTYVIRSQFPIERDIDFNKKFNKRRKIYQRKRGGRS
jgi:hypothetical protein